MLIHIKQIAEGGTEDLGSTNMLVPPQLGARLVFPPRADQADYREYVVELVTHEVNLIPKKFLGEVKEIVINVQKRAEPNYDEDEPTLAAAERALQEGVSDVVYVYVSPIGAEPPRTA